MTDVLANYGIMTADWMGLIEAVKPLAGNGVITGMGFSVTGTDLNVTIQAGSCRANGTKYTFASSTGIAFAGDVDPTYPRKALIVVNATGTIVRRLGTPGQASPSGLIRRYTYDPDLPDMVTGDIPLYEVWLGAGATVIASADVSDRKLICADAVTGGGSVFGRGTYAARPAAGNIGNVYYAYDVSILYRDNGSKWETILGGSHGCQASEFAASGSGTWADPYPIQAIIDAITYARDSSDWVARAVELDGSVFRGSTSIAFPGRINGLVVKSNGMGGFATEGAGPEGPYGKGTVIDYTGSGRAFDFEGTAHRYIFTGGMTIKGTSAATAAMYFNGVYRLHVDSVLAYGFTAAGAWGFDFENCFSADMGNLYPFNCMGGLKSYYTANNGMQARLAWIETDHYGLPGTGLYLKGCLGAVLTDFMAVGMAGSGSKGLWLSSCKGIGLPGVYVEGLGAGNLVDIAVQVDNSETVALYNPMVTKVSGYGFYEFGNSVVPRLINPQLGADSGVNSTGTGIQGYWDVENPKFLAEWTGSQYGGNQGYLRVLQQVAGDTPNLTQNSATPSIGGGRGFRTNNTLATTITQFNGGIVGSLITVRAGDTNTTIQHGTNIFLKSGANKTLGLYETITLYQYSSSRWDEI